MDEAWWSRCRKSVISAERDGTWMQRSLRGIHAICLKAGSIRAHQHLNACKLSLGSTGAADHGMYAELGNLYSMKSERLGANTGWKVWCDRPLEKDSLLSNVEIKMRRDSQMIWDC